MHSTSLSFSLTLRLCCCCCWVSFYRHRRFCNGKLIAKPMRLFTIQVFLCQLCSVLVCGSLLALPLSIDRTCIVPLNCLCCCFVVYRSKWIQLNAIEGKKIKAKNIHAIHFHFHRKENGLNTCEIGNRLSYWNMYDYYVLNITPCNNNFLTWDRTMLEQQMSINRFRQTMTRRALFFMRTNCCRTV